MRLAWLRQPGDPGTALPRLKLFHAFVNVWSDGRPSVRVRRTPRHLLWRWCDCPPYPPPGIVPSPKGCRPYWWWGHPSCSQWSLLCPCDWGSRQPWSQRAPRIASQAVPDPLPSHPITPTPLGSGQDFRALDQVCTTHPVVLHCCSGSGGGICASARVLPSSGPA